MIPQSRFKGALLYVEVRTIEVHKKHLPQTNPMNDAATKNLSCATACSAYSPFCSLGFSGLHQLSQIFTGVSLMTQRSHGAFRFVMTGYPQFSSILDLDLFMKPFSYWGSSISGNLHVDCKKKGYAALTWDSHVFAVFFSHWSDHQKRSI